MAWFWFYLSYENRRDISLLLFLPNLIFFVCSVLIMISGTFIFWRAHILGDLTSTWYTNAQSIFIAVVGLNLAIIHGIGFKVLLVAGDWKALYENMSFWRICTFFWLLAVAFYAPCLLLSLMGASYIPGWTLNTAFTEGMKAAINQYRTNIVMKEKLDRLQMHFECCGGDDYNDWVMATWFNPEYMHMDKEIKMSVPFSCCRLDSSRPCINTYISSQDKHYKYFPSVEMTIYTIGCGPALSQFIGGYVMSRMRQMSKYVMVGEIAIALIYRYIQTSIDIALVWADPKQVAQGYLFNLGALPVPPNKTLHREEFDRRKERYKELIDLDHKSEIEEEERLEREKKKKKKRHKRVKYEFLQPMLAQQGKGQVKQPAKNTNVNADPIYTWGYWYPYHHRWPPPVSNRTGPTPFYRPRRNQPHVDERRRQPKSGLRGRLPSVRHSAQQTSPNTASNRPPDLSPGRRSISPKIQCENVHRDIEQVRVGKVTESTGYCSDCKPPLPPKRPSRRPGDTVSSAAAANRERRKARMKNLARSKSLDRSETIPLLS